MDDLTIKDTVLDVLSRIHSPRQAYKAAVTLHNGEQQPYDNMDDEDYTRMQEYEAEQERVRTELLYDDAFAQWVGQTSQDQWAEIDNLFIEDASESSKTLTLERQRQHLSIQKIMTTKPKPETGLTPQRLERMATIVARLSMENNVTPQQVMMRISDNRAAGRPQFDMEADWMQYPAPHRRRTTNSVRDRRRGRSPTRPIQGRTTHASHPLCRQKAQYRNRLRRGQSSDIVRAVAQVLRWRSVRCAARFLRP